MLNLMILVVLALTAIACGGADSKPTFRSLPTPANPPDFVSYTDESNQFRVMYPADWEVNLSVMTKFQDLYESGGSVFFAGFPTGDGVFSPNVNIVVEYLSTTMSLNEYHEGTIEGIREVFPNADIGNRASVLVGDRKAMTMVLSDPGGTLPDAISLITVEGNIAWNITCVWFSVELYQQHAETCDAVVKSFRILQ